LFVFFSWFVCLFVSFQHSASSLSAGVPAETRRSVGSDKCSGYTKVQERV